MTIEANDTLRKFGHFAMQRMNVAGEVVGALVTVTTLAGVLLNSHYSVDHAHAERICEMARLNPNQPYDLSGWTGPTGERTMAWTARIIWRNENV